MGRESTYNFIDLLYRTDWQFEKKTPEGIKMYSLKNGVGGDSSGNYVRIETKFGQVTVQELLEYFTDIDKRLAWENNYYASLEPIRAYPLKTSMYYGKLAQKRGQAAKDSLIITHGVSIKGNREYLSCLSVEHSEYPPEKKVQRVYTALHSNYFEPTTDGKGVKNILIAQMQTQSPGENALTRSFTKEGLN